MNLPPLPGQTRTSVVMFGGDYVIDSYTADQMREYGEARAAHARKQALEEAAQVVERVELRTDDADVGTVAAREIRSLIK